ncbi:hypothetical protein ACHAP5_009335 [Fusarium lateritium]
MQERFRGTDKVFRLAESSEKAFTSGDPDQEAEALQHEMIIPRTPSPGPSSETGLVADALSQLSESDIRRLAMERLQENMVKDESPRVKREADRSPCTPRQWKMINFDDGKMAVDLTDD